MNVVRIVGRASGAPTPLDGGFVVDWDPHTRFGICDVTITRNRAKARQFADAGEVHSEWAAISRVQPTRPDGKPNRPLAGLTIEILKP